MSIANCIISNNQATGGSGAAGPSSGQSTNTSSGGLGEGAAIFNGGTLTVTNSTLSGNRATGGATGSGTGNMPGDGEGGAIFTISGALTITNSTFVDNVATGGAGVGMNPPGGGLGAILFT